MSLPRLSHPGLQRRVGDPGQYPDFQSGAPPPGWGWGQSGAPAAPLEQPLVNESDDVAMGLLGVGQLGAGAARAGMGALGRRQAAQLAAREAPLPPLPMDLAGAENRAGVGRLLSNPPDPYVPPPPMPRTAMSDLPPLGPAGAARVDSLPPLPMGHTARPGLPMGEGPYVSSPFSKQAQRMAGSPPTMVPPPSMPPMPPVGPAADPAALQAYQREADLAQAYQVLHGVRGTGNTSIRGAPGMTVDPLELAGARAQLGDAAMNGGLPAQFQTPSVMGEIKNYLPRTPGGRVGDLSPSMKAEFNRMMAERGWAPPPPMQDSPMVNLLGKKTR